MCCDCICVCMCPFGACFPKGTIHLFVTECYNIFLLTFKLSSLLVINIPREKLPVDVDFQDPFDETFLTAEEKSAIKRTCIP